VTATLINVIATPETAELAGLATSAGLSSLQGPPVSGQSGNRQSFSAAMKTAGNPHGAEGSEPQLPVELTVTGAGFTAPTTVLGLSLSSSATTPGLMAGEAVDSSQLLTGVPDQIVNPDGLTGKPLPEPNADTGNTLPSFAGQSEVLTLVPYGSGGSSTAASTATLQQAAIDPMQTAVANVAPRSIMPDNQISRDVNISGHAPTLASADEPATPMPRPGIAPDPGLEANLPGAGHARNSFESRIMQAESAIPGRTAAVANLATMISDAGSAGFAQVASAAPTPAGFDQMMELPQFQNLRPLQPMADPQTFTEGLGQRLMVMTEQGVQSARMKLYPENLGSLDIRIQVEDDTARVWFNAQPGQARDALEAALPKLKELFAQQGMELLEAGVGSDNERREANEAFEHPDGNFPGPVDGEPGMVNEMVGPPAVAYVSARVLDVYV